MSTDNRLCYCVDCNCITRIDCIEKGCSCCTYLSQKGEFKHIDNFVKYPDTGESGQTYEMEQDS